MCLAAVALRFAFPHTPYMIRQDSFPSTISNGSSGNANGGRIVTMQSISNNLKETMNPKDIMHGRKNSIVLMNEENSIDLLVFSLDAIHNFHPQYRDYTQYNAQVNLSSLSISFFR